MTYGDAEVVLFACLYLGDGGGEGYGDFITSCKAEGDEGGA